MKINHQGEPLVLVAPPRDYFLVLVAPTGDYVSTTAQWYPW